MRRNISVRQHQIDQLFDEWLDRAGMEGLLSLL
jgi:hypothetical protein